MDGWRGDGVGFCGRRVKGKRQRLTNGVRRAPDGIEQILCMGELSVCMRSKLVRSRHARERAGMEGEYGGQGRGMTEIRATLNVDLVVDS